MVQKILIFTVITVGYFVWYLILNFEKKSTSHLLLSFVITNIPFQMSIPAFLPTYSAGVSTGSFTAKFFLTIPLIVSLILLCKQNNKGIFHLYKNERWITWILGLVLISLINPYNFAFLSTLAFAFFFLSYILFFKLIYNTTSPIVIINGVYLSFNILCVLQFVLAILYPLLNMSFVTAIFQTGGEQWATRVGTRPGAIGVFVTPANLGLYTTIASCFFFASFLSNYKKKTSLLLLSLSTLTIFLTYSRTSYITLTFVLFIIYYINKNAKKAILSFRMLFFGLLPALLVIYWLIYYSPLNSTFLETDAGDMYEARFDHWLIGLEIFKSSPIFGVGINTHLEFISRNVKLYREIHNEFLTTNPIHNTHLIILAETGIIGLLMWIYFIVSSIKKAKLNVANSNNLILSLTQIGLLVTYIIYGVTDWAPLSLSTFPIFLMFTFFFNKYSFTNAM